MKILKNTLSVLLALLVVVSPFLAVLSAVLLLPPRYSDTFVGALDEKYERLSSIEGEKIVVVGGSSVAFGVDSELLSRYTGMPVVNFGLYAALGTRLMLDLSLPYVGEGDIVIISPELDPQTLSLYFNPDTTLKALDDDWSMLSHVDGENIPSLLGALWRFVQDKISRMGKTDTTGDSTYLAKYFDELGDYDYPREYNVMAIYYDPNTPINLVPEALGEDFLAFADYLNTYIAAAERRGASVYVSLPPMNELALTEGSLEEGAAEEYLARLSSYINCDVIDDLSAAVMGAGYFFDTNYHLNEVGRTARTVKLAENIRYYLTDIPTGTIEALPEEPSLPGADFEFDGEDENAKYFTYRRDEKYRYYVITGLSEEGKLQRELTIPLGYNGYKVISADRAAFTGGVLEELTLTADANVVSFATGAFEGASSLTDLWIYKGSGNDIMPPADFLGVADGFRVHIPSGSDFTDHYYWSERGLTFVTDAN